MTEKLEQRALWRRISAAGCPLDEIEDAEPGLLIRQNDESEMFVLGPGGTCCVLDVQIVNGAKTAISASGFEIRLPWGGEDFIWPTDPHEQNSKQEIYRLPFGWEFPRDQVLNHRTYKQGKLKFGDWMNGFLLCWGTQAIPVRYKHSTRVSAELAVIDQFGNAHPASIELPVNRLTQTVPKRRVPGGLFAPLHRGESGRRVMETGPARQDRNTWEIPYNPDHPKLWRSDLGGCARGE